MRNSARFLGGVNRIYGENACTRRHGARTVGGSLRMVSDETPFFVDPDGTSTPVNGAEPLGQLLEGNEKVSNALNNFD